MKEIVRKGDQDQGRLGVIEASKNMFKYTYDRVKDNKTFAKSDRWIMAKAVWDAAAKANANIIAANGIRVETPSDAEARLLYEKDAVAQLDVLLALVDTCYTVGIISDRRAEYWLGLINDTQILAKAWLKGDRRRYLGMVVGSIETE